MYQCMWKSGGTEEWEGRKWTTEIIPDAKIADYLAQGWYLTWNEALEAAEKPAEAVKEVSARGSLEAKATELGIKFDGRTTDKKLAELIEAKG